MSKKIILTGAGGGFGKLITIELLKQGHIVTATMRDVAGRNKTHADELTGLGASVIDLDVTSDDSVASGVNSAIANMSGVDVLINNAGVGSLGMQEFYTSEDYRNLFEINVFGVQRMNRAVLPYMRKAQNGLIVYISSLLGRVVMPFYGPYQATKWALEAMAENYRVELSGFGIENVIVEPGGYPTSFMHNLMKPSDDSRTATYGGFAAVPDTMLSTFEAVLKNNPQQDPQKVATAVAEMISMPRGSKPFRLPVDFIGMGTMIESSNAQQEQIMTGLYSNFGMQNMLSVKPE